jgi:hypothetical protein
MDESYFKTSDTDTGIYPRAETNPECGIEKTNNKGKSSVLAALLSLIFPGLGQVYAGDLLKGFAILVGLG